VQTSAGGDLADPATPDLKQRVAKGIAHGAFVIAGLTIVARLFGLIRTLVFSQTVGAGCLGTAYVTANQVPNLVYELVLGGAMTSAMVPILARAAERADSDPSERAYISQVTSAALTWSVIILVPLTLLVVATATPIATALNPANASAHCDRAEMINATSHMLVVFAPQIILYGISVVLYGLLQAYRRFVGPTLGPAISSLVVIAACLAFVPLSDGQPLGSLPMSAELVLSVGTTLGIAALAVVGIVPTWRRAGGLALCGLVEIIFVDLASVVAIALANGHGTTGTIVIFNYATQVFNSVAGVLAISVVLSAFPVLSARDGPEFDRTSAGSTRAILLLSWLGTAAMVAIALPASRVLASEPGQVPELVQSFVLFAPGVAGFAVIANLTRVMFVIGRLKVAAAGLAGCWVITIVLDVVLVQLVPPHLVAAALALGNTVGQTAIAIPLVLVTRRICGPAAVQGAGHATLAGLAAGAVGAGVGVAVCLAAPAGGKLSAAAVAAVAAGGAVIAFGVVAWFLDPGDLRVVVARLRRGGRHRR